MAKVSRTRRPQRGFTLIEIMLVVLIIGILASFALPAYLHMTARADRSESQVVLSKIKLYFINQYENQGFFGSALTVPVGLPGSAWNPTLVSVPLGQAAPWDPTSPGWTDLTFPPEGKILMRYQYTIVNPQQLMLQSCGNLQGLGPATIDCGPGLKGNYKHQELWDGATEDATSPIDLPSSM